MLIQGSNETAGHRHWDWIYYVAAGVAISTPTGSLPWEFPVGYAIAGIAALVVVFRGIWWGWHRGRTFFILGALGILVNGIAISFWIDFHQRLSRLPDRAETSVTEGQLLETIWALEYFHLTRGHYPIEITRLDDELGKLGVGWDFTARVSPDVNHFYYSRTDSDHYVLRAHGRDAKPFTRDDVLPPIPKSDLPHIGFLPDPH